MKKITRFILSLLLMFGLGLSQLSPISAYEFNPNNKELYSAYIDELSQNKTENNEKEANLLNQAEQYSNLDYAVMKNVGQKWDELFSSSWKRYTFKWDKNVSDAKADMLASSPIVDSEKHAFVCLGFQLKDGQMLEELKARCEAVAAAARQYPKTKIYVSGGATGPNNPNNNTEADLMKSYLVETCKIDASRIFTDPRAMTTVQNAENTFAMLQRDGIESITIVTSDYHTRRGTLLYFAESQLFEQGKGYKCKIVANLGSYTGKDLEPASHAARSLKQILGLPNTVSNNSKITVINNQYIYEEDDKLDLTIIAEKLGQKTEIKDYKVVKYNPKNAGKQIVTVSFVADGVEKTAQVEVFVKYKFISELQPVINKEKLEDLTFKTNGLLDKLTGVYLDGKELGKNNYTLKSGSTILTISKNFLKDLGTGQHSIKLVYGKEDKVSMDFYLALNATQAKEIKNKLKNNLKIDKETRENKVTKKSKKINTGDNTSPAGIWATFICLATLLFFIVKKF